MASIDWTGFLLASLVVSAVPGANQLLGLRTAVRQGTVDATVALTGRLAAFVILMGLAAAGLGAVLIASATAFAVVKWVGVAYLAWLGMSLLVSSRRAVPDPESPGRPRRRPALVRQEFLVAITNPKALLLFAAFVPQFAPAAGTNWATLVLLGCVYIAVEAVSATAYTVLGGRVSGAGLSTAVRRWLDAAGGLAFLGLAGALALERRPA